MTSTQYVTKLEHAFMYAKVVMAVVNRGATRAARARAEKVLDDYFALVEQAISWTEHNPLDRRFRSERHMSSKQARTCTIDK